jgi:hypothetical protein
MAIEPIDINISWCLAFSHPRQLQVYGLFLITIKCSVDELFTRSCTKLCFKTNRQVVALDIQAALNGVNADGAVRTLARMALRDFA